MTLFSPGGYGLLIQRAKMPSVITIIIEPNCLNFSIGTTHLVNIDVGTLLKIPAKIAKIMKKNIQKKVVSDLPTLIFLRYETGTTGIFLGHIIFEIEPLYISLEIWRDI